MNIHFLMRQGKRTRCCCCLWCLSACRRQNKNALVSDGLCSFYGRSREDLVQGFNGICLRMSIRMTLRRSQSSDSVMPRRRSLYDIIYRSRLPGSNEYRYVHAVSKFHGMEDGSRVALMYSDITGSLETKKNLKKFNSPAVNFLNENIGRWLLSQNGSPYPFSIIMPSLIC